MSDNRGDTRPPATGGMAFGRPGMPFGRPGGGPPGGPFHGHGPGMPVEKAKDFSGTLKRLSTYLAPQRYQLIAVLVAAVISAVFMVVGPKILGLATTKIFEGVMQKMQGVPGARIEFGYVTHILVILGGMYLVSALFAYFQQYMMAGIAQRTVYALRKDVDEKLGRLPLSFYDSHTHGEILSRAVNDLDNISTTLGQNLTQLITSVLTVFGIVVMMLTISLWLALVVVLTLPMSILITMMVAKRSQIHFLRQQRALGQLNGHVEEMYTGHQIVKAFGREASSIAQFEALNEKLYNAGWRAQFISGIIMPLMFLVGNIGYVLVSVIGGIMVTRQAIAIGDVQAFIQYARQFNQPITQLATLANMIQLTIASAERVFELLDEQEETPEASPAKSVASPRGEVEFQHVTFQYKEGVPLIDDVNIRVEPGQTIAIVGPTGAGKTTLVNLLMRFYDVKSGSILVDGVDIRDLKRADLRRMFGMVLQDTWLFSGTIRENIAYGREGASEEEIRRAARAAQADHFIRTLPKSYDTILNQEATDLSQGQKQLLTIARAFLADPEILILDEATSSVDTRTEIQIQEAMHTLMKGRTSFVIAHRLSTIRHADLILVMNRGRIVEKGTHAELMAKGGFYADLYNSQFTGRSLEETVV